MGVIDRLLSGNLFATDSAGSPAASADFWYKDVGARSAAGLAIDADAAQRVSGFFRGITLLSNDVAKLPLDIFERLPAGEKRRAPSHPLYDVLHTKPNVWQSSFEWRRQGVRDVVLGGNWYNRILPGPRGPIDQLRRIKPSLVTPVQLASGRIAYNVRNANSTLVQTFTQDEIFHVRGVSDDGVEGKSLLNWARDSVGIARATETYASKLFSQGSLHSGTITVPGVLNKDASERMAETFSKGSAQWHLPKVLEQGATYTESQLTPEDSQFLLSRQFSVTEMCRWLGIPPHKLFDLDRATNNNIEHQGIEYFGDGLQPWLVLIEQAILRDLILNAARFYAEFNAEGMLRGDSAARGELYSKMFLVGAASPNDIARRENYEIVDGGDQRFVPANMRPIDQPFDPAAAGSAPPPTPAAPKTPPTATPARPAPPARRTSKAQEIVTESASRLLRKEVAAVQRAAVKFANDEDAFVSWVGEFYTAHVALVQETLRMDTDQAHAYCCRQAQQIAEAGWLAALETWKTDDYAAGLAELALEEAAA